MKVVNEAIPRLPDAEILAKLFFLRTVETCTQNMWSCEQEKSTNLGGYIQSVQGKIPRGTTPSKFVQDPRDPFWLRTSWKK